jgi:hypothetical protein
VELRSTSEREQTGQKLRLGEGKTQGRLTVKDDVMKGLGKLTHSPESLCKDERLLTESCIPIDEDDAVAEAELLTC